MKQIQRWTLTTVVCLALLGAACSDAPDPRSARPSPNERSRSPAAAGNPSPAETSTPGSCSNEAAVVTDRTGQIGDSAQADVDGDGLIDQVAVVADEDGSRGCRAFVIADLGGGGVAVAPVWEVGPEGGLPQPRLNSAVDINSDGRDEAVVDEAAGASTQFVGVFTFVDGDLQRMSAEGRALSSDVGGVELFGYGGSVGHLDAIDCAARGRVVVTQAVPTSDPNAAAGVYEVTRRFAEVNGATLGLVYVERTATRDTSFARFPEFAGSPFAGC